MWLIHKKDKLEEMSKPLKTLLKEIRDLEYELNSHILKILLFPKSNSINHWKNEISTWLLKIGRLKSQHNKGYLDYSMYRKLLYDEPFENGYETYNNSTLKKTCDIILTDDKYKNVFSEYKEKVIPIKEWKYLLLQFYDSICGYLEKGILVRQIVIDLIDDLFL